MEVDGKDVFFDVGGVFEVAFAGEELSEAFDCYIGNFELGIAFGCVSDRAIVFVAFDGDSALKEGVDVDRVRGGYSGLWW